MAGDGDLRGPVWGFLAYDYDEVLVGYWMLGETVGKITIDAGCILNAMGDSESHRETLQPKIYATGSKKV